MYKQLNTIQPQREWNPVICRKMDGTRKHCQVRHKRQIINFLPHMSEL